MPTLPFVPTRVAVATAALLLLIGGFLLLGVLAGTGAALFAKLGVTPMARIVAQATSGLAPKMLLMTPVEATRKVAAKAGWALGDWHGTAAVFAIGDQKLATGNGREWYARLQFGVVVPTRAREGVGPAAIKYIFAVGMTFQIHGRGADHLSRRVGGDQVMGRPSGFRRG